MSRLLDLRLALATAVVLVGCACLPTSYDQKGGPAIVQAIRAALGGCVNDAFYMPGDALDPASAEIRLRRALSPSELDAFVCGVVIAAVVAGDPPEGFDVHVASGGEERFVGANPNACAPSPA